MESKSSKHIVWGSLLGMIVLVFQMFAALIKVRVILTNYGHEYYSIFQSTNSIFSYLILIESGFSVAYLLKMYEPYAKKDYSKVQSLYMGLEHMLYKVAALMMVGVVGITIIYPLILADNNLGAWEIRILIALCGMKFVLPYFFTVAKKQILNVVEKSYLISIIDSLLNLITDIIIIMVACLTDWRFIATVIVSVLMLIPSIAVYTYILHHYKKRLNFSSDVVPSYEASSMTKDIMAQKLAYLADNNVDQIILSTRDLLQTTVYTTFSSVVSYPVSLINQLISSFRGHMGVRLADNINSSFVPFRKLLSINLYIATVVSSVFILQAQPFVKLWIGDTYKATDVTVYLFAIILFRKCAENTITITKEGRDLYKESKKYALCAAAVNFVLSIVLVQFFEINGLLLGTIVADLLVLDYNNYRMVFHNVFKRKIDISRELVPSVVALVLSVLVKYSKWFSMLNQSTWVHFVMNSIVISLIVALTVLVAYVLCSCYMRKAVLYFIPYRERKG